LRRAARHGRKLGIQGKFLAGLATTVIDLSKDGYPELEEKQAMILEVLSKEEDKFNKTIDQGLAILSDMEASMAEAGVNTLSGENAFKLYDTYGFPLDLTKEILEEKGLGVDEDGFQVCMKKQKETARGARKTTNYMGKIQTIYDDIDPTLTSQFVGYDSLKAQSRITVITTNPAFDAAGELAEYGEIVEAVADGTACTIITEETPFYGTMGGQEGDIGVIENGNGTMEVRETIHLKGGKIAHIGVMTSGMFTTGETVTLKVNEARRMATAKNHSATHLLQKALREVLGSHVEQAGSLVTPDHLRFDFTHFAALTQEELQKVEDIVNEKIQENLTVNTQVMTLEEAKKTGAMALFGEKYGDAVRVVNMGDWSIELCGGTHVKNTGSISRIKIVSEAGVAAGVRRIEALTDQAVFQYYANLEKQLQDLAVATRATVEQLPKRIESMQEEIRSLKAENEKLKAKMAKDAAGDILSQAKEIQGIKILASKVEGVDMNGLRNLGDQLKEKLGECVVVLASTTDGKVNLMATATDGAMKLGAHAGNLIKEIAAMVGGGGGGRPNMAQAGGKNPAGVEAAMAKAYEVSESQLSK
jgi:alanyl-tRNA synthetase